MAIDGPEIRLKAALNMVLWLRVYAFNTLGASLV